MTIPKAQTCSCNQGLCPKIKGVEGEYGGLHEDGLDIVVYRKNVLCNGNPSQPAGCDNRQKVGTFRGAAYYDAEYVAVGHFRNDGSGGTADTQYIWLHKHGVTDTNKCNGYHLSQNLAIVLCFEINNALTSSGGDKFCMRNHDNGCKCPTEYWTRAGITDVRDKLVAALGDWPA